jgi:hypothetical protein
MLNTPKLLNLSVPIVRNERKIIWLQNQDPTVNWSKWDAVITGLSSFNHWSQLHTKIVGIIVTEVTSDINTLVDELFVVSKKVPLLLLSQSILSLKSEQFWSENFDNILNLDNILEQYPFINTVWDGTYEDAVSIFALLMRYNKIIDCKVSNTRSQYLLCNNISCEFDIKPNEIWVITQFFRHKSDKRFSEIKDCLSKNCECPNIDKIVLINEKDYSQEYNKLFGSDKIQQVITGKRLTYSDFLKFVKENVPQNVFTILCNADIHFGKSLLNLHKINLNDKMLALLRWDVPTLSQSKRIEDIENDEDVKLFGPRADSQDTWIFLSNSIKSRTWDYSKFNFQLGQAGCDNAFAGQILRNKFVISNPSLSFKTFHIHNTNIRNYDKKDFIRSDIYLNIAPTYIIDSKQEYVPPGKPDCISNEVVPFEIKSSSLSNEITYCTMLEKEGRYKWEPSVENYYFCPKISIYNWKNACVTPNGLVYDLFNIYKGKSDDEQFNYWENANVDILTPLQKRDRMFAIPFKNTDVFKHPDLYILNYMSRCVRLLKQYPNTSFWIPPNFKDYIQYFDWGVNKLNGAIFDENTGCWADTVIGFLPGPDSMELGNEDISALRSIYSSWIEKPSNKTCAIVLGKTITHKFAEEKIVKLLQNKSDEWTVRYVNEEDYASYDALLGSSLCIFVGGKKEYKTWAKLWALPKDCCVIEFQQELQIDGEFQHIAHISGFKSWVLLLSKGSLNDVQEQILEQLEKWFKKNEDEIQ